MLSQNFRLFVFAAFAAVSGCQTTLPDNDSVLYYGFSRVDPDNETVTDNSWIVLSGGAIEQVGVGRPPLRSFSNNRDMSGLYAMPGLIDAHEHITAGAHKIEIIDGVPAITIESVDKITQFHARVALAFGITTVRTPGGDPVANARYNKNIAEKVWVGPDALHAGAVMLPPPFVGNAFEYPQGEAEWQAVAAREAVLGMTNFKLYTDLSEEVLEFARRLHEAGVPIMIGTDGYGGGPSYAHELQLHFEAGTPVWAVLRYATSAAAEMLELSAQVGKIADGMEEDIVFLKANPVDDVANVEHMHTLIAYGTEYSFEELTAHTLTALDAGE